MARGVGRASIHEPSRVLACIFVVVTRRDGYVRNVEVAGSSPVTSTRKVLVEMGAVVTSGVGRRTDDAAPAPRTRWKALWFAMVAWLAHAAHLSDLRLDSGLPPGQADPFPYIGDVRPSLLYGNVERQVVVDGSTPPREDEPSG